MDGMSVGVGEEVYIPPLSSVVESFQVEEHLVKTIGASGRVVEVRDEYMPVVELERLQRPAFRLGKVQRHHGGGRGRRRPGGPAGGRAVWPATGGGERTWKPTTARCTMSGATIAGDGRVASSWMWAAWCAAPVIDPSLNPQLEAMQSSLNRFEKKCSWGPRVPDVPP